MSVELAWTIDDAGRGAQPAGPGPRRRRGRVLLLAAGFAPSVGAALQVTFGIDDLPAFQRAWLEYARANP
jgi:hypothetical protein